MLPVTDHVGIPTKLNELVSAVGTLTTLQDVLRWGFQQTPPCTLAEVVVQDEFTHDVVMGWTDALFLVFDTT